MQMLRIKQVVAMTGLSRMTIYRLEKGGDFPSRRQLGSNSVAWLATEVSTWIESRPIRCNRLGHHHRDPP